MDLWVVPGSGPLGGTLETGVRVPVPSLMLCGFGKSLPLLNSLFPSLQK